MKRLTKIVADVLGIKESQVRNSLKRGATEAWDSFNHLMLISEIEKELGIHLTMADVERIQTFKDLREVVAKKS